MLHYALVFLFLAVLFGVLGFSGVVVGTLMWAVKACVVLFIVLALLSFFRNGNVDTTI